jgi:uncharacterized membrane protein YbaN (DUF454 family)
MKTQMPIVGILVPALATVFFFALRVKLKKRWRNRETKRLMKKYGISEELAENLSKAKS